MKIALLATIAVLGVTMGAQAMQFPPSAISFSDLSSSGCGSLVHRTAAIVGEPFSCCNHDLGCAQFLATTRVEVHKRTPRT